MQPKKSQEYNILYRSAQALLNLPNTVLMLCNIAFTVEPPNNGHSGDRSLVHCREVVPISEVTECMLQSVGGNQFVRSTEVVRFSECPLSEVPLYTIARQGTDHEAGGCIGGAGGTFPCCPLHEGVSGELSCGPRGRGTLSLWSGSLHYHLPLRGNCRGWSRLGGREGLLG